MDKLLAEALRRACHGNQRAVSALREIEERLRGATQVDDLGVVRSSLAQCLATVQAEVARQVIEGGTSRTTLETVIAQRRSEPDSGGFRDNSPTGLPGRQESRVCLEKARVSAGKIEAVALSLDRMSVVESRFGVKASESYLLVASQAIAQKLSGHDELFQWGCHAFLAVVECAGSGHVELCGPHRPCTIKVDARTVLIPISISSLRLRVSEAPDTDTILERIDSFLSRVEA